MISDDESIVDVLRDEPDLLQTVRSVLGNNFKDNFTLGDIIFERCNASQEHLDN